MPLIDIAQALNLGAVGDRAANLQVVVYTEGGRSVGLIVDRIVDIVEQTVAVERERHDEGLLGSAVIQDRVTDLLNVGALVKQVPGQEMYQ